MKFEKIFLILLGSVFTIVLSTPARAAEKLSSMEAVWNAVGVTPNANPVAQKKAAPKTNKANNSQAEAKLARQRAMWRAKWEAQQRAKKNKNATVAKAAAKPVWKKPVAAPAKAPVKQLAKQQAPKPLTREQYIWRWKQQQLKEKQLAGGNAPAKRAPAQRPATNKIPSFTNADINTVLNGRAPLTSKRTAFRQNKQPAAISSLPFAVKNKLHAAKLSSNGMSAYVQDVNSPRPLLGHQATTSRVPASVMKLITSYAALGALGPKYRWPLDVYTKGQVRGGTLQGDLIIKGYGSPEFKQAELRKVLQGIRNKGIRNVSGRVVFDNTYFNVPNQGSFDGKSQSAYNAQPDALLYNERLSSFQIRSTGKRVHVSTTTPTHNLKIVNNMRTTKRGCRPHIKVSKRGVQTVVTFSGRFSRRCGTRSYHRVISRPAEMIYGAMQAMWKRDVGGKLNTRFAMGKAPANARPLLRTYSRTLAEILPSIDKDSNNVMARQVMLTIGAKSTGQGTQRSGANAIGTWLASRGLNFPELRIENGSGLSRTARISARHVGDLLVDAYRSPFRNILMQSLAVAGVDGTMKRRLKGTGVRGRGFFKTGTLRDVRSIAGYVKAADGKTYVMAILHNDPRAKRRALAAHDKLIEWVYSGGRSHNVAMR
ncbi:D-alanyl-D-alanine carboxypeptidase/D-alanyl-D-alanine-endopeptidase [uncultured Cocleimonas sp.]|uniref:D-alanyl-D-alanine carboxypeptidase/D-alanyl-D-alanine endopeptidase n=1 Tax=uncultured Cocleimonas sp. TaxID=1051587 RepID=UPI0026209E52|nr:D-alanyl-D-alanine carboxypeptidase/D-alanyl-D-alanine-endopeptidase [uncultured Cocleimonas sp.]